MTSPKTAFLLNILREPYQAVEGITLENVLGYILVMITHALFDWAPFIETNDFYTASSDLLTFSIKLAFIPTKP